MWCGIRIELLFSKGIFKRGWVTYLSVLIKAAPVTSQLKTVKGSRVRLMNIPVLNNARFLHNSNFFTMAFWSSFRAWLRWVLREKSVRLMFSFKEDLQLNRTAACDARTSFLNLPRDIDKLAPQNNFRLLITLHSRRSHGRECIFSRNQQRFVNRDRTGKE